MQSETTWAFHNLVSSPYCGLHCSTIFSTYCALQIVNHAKLLHKLSINLESSAHGKHRSFEIFLHLIIINNLNKIKPKIVKSDHSRRYFDIIKSVRRKVREIRNVLFSLTLLILPYSVVNTRNYSAPFLSVDLFDLSKNFCFGSWNNKSYFIRSNEFLRVHVIHHIYNGTNGIKTFRSNSYFAKWTNFFLLHNLCSVFVSTSVELLMVR